MDFPTISEKTIASKFKRLAYFHGMLLTEADFLEEQAYFREKMKLHNRLHGEGVVWGLKVDFEEEKDENNTVITNKISIEPGLAFDAAGNEIIVSNPYSEDITAQLAFIKDSTTVFCKNPACQNGDRELLTIIHIGIQYGECPSNLSNQYITTCSEVPQEQYSRMREGFKININFEVKDYGNSSGKCKRSEPQYCDGIIIELADIYICKTIETTRTESGDQKTNVKITFDVDDARHFDSEKVFGRWDNARKHVLQMIKMPEDVIDLYCFIGRHKNWVINKCNEMKLTITKSKKISGLSIEDLNEIRNATPYIKKTENVTVSLITDNLDEKVLFILPK